MRTAEVYRKTIETEVHVKVNLDSLGRTNGHTGIAFLDHVVATLAFHSLIDIDLSVKGDLKHHITEDVAICLGQAIRKALGDGEGITRFGFAAVPMDCSLVFSAVDLAKRPYAKVDLKLKGEKIEDMPCEDIRHFLETLATSMQANIHIWTQYGANDHHKAEAAFKALALSLRQAIAIDPRRKSSPSVKGVI
ncbi:MAG: imidazoleglycerol-phosphate dehydratase [Candidatus Bathyarchaeota archaeon]|nr:imidazoleglycerol-phosphate dehydratase [Candidatus Bathyarchaeota archaeon]MDW8022977.1 imidazoleglycerol-phosphate dehydratase [Nitrososphaerota archaeon]MDW8041073.1 imidazoleglycerol-phosphate dehydratase [Nitrososphaerota archaeon]